jgi:hypothetical protein
LGREEIHKPLRGGMNHFPSDDSGTTTLVLVVMKSRQACLAAVSVVPLPRVVEDEYP